jgi:osmoprotectant transport system permease protein
VGLLQDTWTAFTDPINDGWGQLWLQVEYTLVSLGLATLIGVVLGIISAKVGSVASFLVVTVGNLGRTVPTFAIIALVVALSTTGFWPVVVGLVALGVPPILINSYTGIREVDAGAVEAARGMGFTPAQVLGRVEMPLAVPLIFAGIRISAVQIVATATLAGLVGGGGLGVLVAAGIGNNQNDVLLAGAIPVAILAILAELVFGGAERLATPKGLRIGRRLAITKGRTA